MVLHPRRDRARRVAYECVSDVVSRRQTARLQLKGQPDGEHHPCPRFAVDGDCSTAGFDELSDDRKRESAARWRNLPTDLSARQYRSKPRGKSSKVMPLPVSSTVRITMAPVCRAVSVTVPCAGLCRSALATKLHRTWRILAGPGSSQRSRSVRWHRCMPEALAQVGRPTRFRARRSSARSGLRRSLRVPASAAARSCKSSMMQEGHRLAVQRARGSGDPDRSARRGWPPARRRCWSAGSWAMS